MSRHHKNNLFARLHRKGSVLFEKQVFDADICKSSMYWFSIYYYIYTSMMYWFFYCCLTNYNKITSLKQHRFIYFIIPVSQESRHSLIKAFAQGLTYWNQYFNWVMNMLEAWDPLTSSLVVSKTWFQNSIFCVCRTQVLIFLPDVSWECCPLLKPSHPCLVTRLVGNSHQVRVLFCKASRISAASSDLWLLDIFVPTCLRSIPIRAPSISF